MKHPLLVTGAIAIALLSACADTPVQPSASGDETVQRARFDFLNSGNPQAAFLIRENFCGVLLTEDVDGPVSNFDGKFYYTETSSGVVNLNCTGATLPAHLIPEKSYSFKLDFFGATATNRILKSGIAHSNLHVKF